MKSFLRFLAISAAVLLLSCVLAPILFKFLPFKFEKIFNRLVMIFTLTAMAIFVRFDLKKISAYGFSNNAAWRPQIVFGFLSGVITLTLLTVLKVYYGAAHWSVDDISALRWIGKAVSITANALFIGVLEELFFRGVIFQSLTKKFNSNVILAIIVTSVFYSILHFISSTKPYIGPDPGFADSLKLLVSPFMSLLKWNEYWRGAVGLFIFGAVLNLLRVQTKSLFVPIGLHAGCVFFVKIDKLFAEFSNGSPLLWGSAKMYDSIVGWIFLAAMGGIMIYLISRQHQPLELKTEKTREF